jgi:ProP effector
MTDTPPVPTEATTGLPPTPAAEPTVQPVDTTADAPVAVQPEAAAAAVTEAAGEAIAPAQADAEAAAEGAEIGTAAETPAAPGAAPRVELSPAACAAELSARFPALFGAGAPRPLKLRIQADIQARAPGVFTRKSLSVFLHRYTTSNAYLNALSRAPQRVDLDGADAGEIADEHRSAAAEELARRRAVHETRIREQRAAENAARREAEAQQRQARAVDDEARRERAALLRAFETSTLTRANFCALKRIAETELDAQLAQARQEREQRALEPRPEQRPNERFAGPGPGRRDGPPGAAFDRPREARGDGPRPPRNGGPRGGAGRRDGGGRGPGGPGPR